MKITRLFGQTLRDAPADAEVASHQLLIRAGFIRPLGTGIFSYLHLATRAMQKITSILREEMNRIGGQEVTMPVVHPADLWKETGRWYQIGSEMGRFKDKSEHEMVLAMTHEEVVADLVRREVQSYKHLPRLIYHIQTKWRDDPRPRAGLIRVREFTMKDSYSLDTDWEGLDRQYRNHYQAYFNIYRRCGLDVLPVMSDTGMMGGKMAHEFMYLTPIGEDTIILCDACGYTANRQVARFQRLPSISEAIKSTEKIYTPECKSIEDLSNYLNIPKSKTAKAVFFVATKAPNPKETQSHLRDAENHFIFAVIRGDLELNETKLANAVGARDLRPATEDEILAVGAVPGYASPMNISSRPRHEGLDVKVVVDHSVTDSPNLVAGANEHDYHMLNTNYGRDYTAEIVTDIAAVEEGQPCQECGKSLRVARGVEVGNIFKLGTRYSEALGCNYLDRDGQQRPVVMGSYGIGVGRLLACIAEEHHDQNGLVWPVTVAPYHVHLVLLRGKGAPQAEAIAEKIYLDLVAAGIEVLFDDRDESPGVKFNDADLIGLPIRITVSERGLSQGCVEIKLRNKTEKIAIPLDSVIIEAQGAIQNLVAEINARCVPVEYRDYYSIA